MKYVFPRRGLSTEKLDNVFQKRCVDDVICLVHTGKAEKLLQHMDTVDPTDSIIFTREDEEHTSWMPSSPERKMEA